MKNLFIIDGAAGTGKSDLLKYLTKEKQTIGIMTKLTTRNKRDEEEDSDYILDLEFDKQKFYNSCNKPDFYKYGYRDEQYGFFKSDLINKLSNHDNVFIIIRNNDLVNRLKAEFPDIKIIFVYIYSDIVQLRERLKKLKYDKAKIEFRLKGNKKAWEDYLKYSKDYDEILINISNTTQYEALIDNILTKYNKSNKDCIDISYQSRFTLIKPLIGHKTEICKTIKEYPYEKNVFLMMRYREYNEYLYDHIKNIIKSKGFNCVRADMLEWDITHNVYNPIAVLYGCKYGIALFDKPEENENNQYNPNVAYELGMMHIQRKECLILKHKSLDKLPFDIIKDLYSEYNYPKDINNHIENWIKTKLIK